MEVPWSSGISDEAPMDGLDGQQCAEPVLRDALRVGGGRHCEQRDGHQLACPQGRLLVRLRVLLRLPPRRAAACLPASLRARRAAAAFEATQVRWVWWWCELFVQALVGSHSQLFAADALLQEGDVQQPELSLSLSLDACVAYWVRVALCSAACSILSEASSPITLAAYVVAPGAVQNLEVAALSSTSLRVQWAEPAELGGASIRYYVVRRSWMASMAVIQSESESESESEVASTNCFLDLQSVQSVQSVQHAPIYLSVAAFTGYLSRQEKIPAVLYAVCVESGGGH